MLMSDFYFTSSLTLASQVRNAVKQNSCQHLADRSDMVCGERGIRTHGPVTRTTVFETAPIDHSGISPVAQNPDDLAAANIIDFYDTVFVTKT